MSTAIEQTVKGGQGGNVRAQAENSRPGEQLAPPPALPPLVFTTAEVTQLRPLLGAGDVLIDGGSLSVIGRRAIPAPMSAAVHRMEIPYGRFERRIDLRSGMYEITRRDVADGCLFITLRKHS